MRAAVFHGRRDVRIEDIPAPMAPSSGEVILEVVRAAICGTDATEWAHGPKMSSLRRPHPVTGHCGPVVLGHEFVGVVTDAADDVEGLSVGERVVPGCGGWCGTCVWCRGGRTSLCKSRFLVGMHRHGGLAELAAVPAKMCFIPAESVSDDAAAIAQPLAVAIHALERGRVAAGPLVVVGAGGIGAPLIAVAAHRGSQPLIVIDISEARLRRARELGADHTFIADAPDLASEIADLTDGDGPEVVVEASGAPSGLSAAAQLVRPGGRILLLGLQSAPRELDLFAMTQWEVEIVPSNAHVCTRDLPAALELLATSDLADQVIAHRIGLDDLVENGLAPLADGRARGKVVIDPRK